MHYQDYGTTILIVCQVPTTVLLLLLCLLLKQAAAFLKSVGNAFIYNEKLSCQTIGLDHPMYL